MNSEYAYSVLKAVGCVCVAFLLMGIGPCKTPDGSTDIPDKPPRDVAPSLGDAAATASKAANEVDSSTNKIKSSATTVMANADLAESKSGAAKPQVKPHLDIIKSEAGNIITEADRARLAGVEVTKLASQLQALMVDVQTLTSRSDAQAQVIKEKEDENAKLQEELEQAQSDKTAALRKAMMWMIIAGAIVIAICMTLFFTGNPKAIGGAVAGIVLVSTALAIMAMTKYMWLFGIVGSIGVIVVLGVMIYHITEHLKHKKGLEEVVETTEALKQELPDDVKDRIFGPLGERGRAGQLQSKATEALVKEAKQRLRIAKNAVR